MSTSNAAATAVNTAPSQAPVDPFDDPVTSNKMAVRALIPLLITFVLGTLCLQGFNLVFQQVGADVGAGSARKVAHFGSWPSMER